MITLDPFKNDDAFGSATLTGVINTVDYNPSLLGSRNLFAPKPVKTKDILVDREQDTLSLIGFSERGSAAQQNTRGTRDMVNLSIPRIAVQDTIWAREVANLRVSGTTNELMTVAVEANKRLTKMRQQVEYTKEYLRLASIQGLVLDPADGSTTLNFYTAFNKTAAAEYDFELDDDTIDVAEKCRILSRQMMRAAKNAWIVGRSKIEALVGDDFFDQLIKHPSVKATWLNWQAAAELRGIDPWSEFNYGGITFINYRGSDDNSTIAIAATKAKFYVAGGDDIFVEAMAPADEWIDHVNTDGQPVYAFRRMDKEYDTPRFVGFDVHSYPLFMCQKPETLRSGTAS